jgi:hypothetical protein
MILVMYFTNLWNLLKATATIWGPFVSGLIAGLIAAFVVHLLTQSRDRERWILDCKKQEFREVLSAIAESHWATLKATVKATGQPFTLLDEQDQRNLHTANGNAFRTLNDRIYIVQDLNLRELSNAWMVALNSRDGERLSDEYLRINATIVEAANRCVPKTTMQKLKFWKR